MNNNFRKVLKAFKEISDPESMKLALEKITGKKLADYEGIDALIGALMGYYNNKIDTIIKNSWKINAKPIGNTATATNLNSITEPGFYISSSDGNIFENKPLDLGGGAFSLIVESIEPASSRYINQYIRDWDNNKMWIRHTTEYAPNGFSKWAEILTSDNNQLTNKLDKGKIPNDWDSAEKIKGKVEERLKATDNKIIVIKKDGQKYLEFKNANGKQIGFMGFGSSTNSDESMQLVKTGGVGFNLDGNNIKVTGDKLIMERGNIIIPKGYSLRFGTAYEFYGMGTIDDNTLVIGNPDKTTKMDCHTKFRYVPNVTYSNGDTEIRDGYSNSRFSYFYPISSLSGNYSRQFNSIDFFKGVGVNELGFVNSSDGSLKCTKAGRYRLSLKLYINIENRSGGVDCMSRLIKKSASNGHDTQLLYFEANDSRRNCFSGEYVLILKPNDKLFLQTSRGTTSANVEYVDTSNYAESAGGRGLNALLIERIGDDI